MQRLFDPVHAFLGKDSGRSNGSMDKELA